MFRCMIRASHVASAVVIILHRRERGPPLAKGRASPFRPCRRRLPGKRSAFAAVAAAIRPPRREGRAMPDAVIKGRSAGTPARGGLASLSMVSARAPRLDPMMRVERGRKVDGVQHAIALRSTGSARNRRAVGINRHGFNRGRDFGLRRGCRRHRKPEYHAQYGR